MRVELWRFHYHTYMYVYAFTCMYCMLVERTHLWLPSSRRRLKLQELFVHRLIHLHDCRHVSCRKSKMAIAYISREQQMQ